MASYVVQIPDMYKLLESWDTLLKENPGHQGFTANYQVLATLDQWQLIRWFYYCDDQNGNTIRLYDTGHFKQFGDNYYLEPDGKRKEHFERVIIRGRNMWSGDEASLERADSLRNRFRNLITWRRFSARQAPLRPGSKVPSGLGLKVKLTNPPTVDIQSGMSRDRRLWYFESLNCDPPFDPPVVIAPAGSATPASLFERLRALRAESKPSKT